MRILPSACLLFVLLASLASDESVEAKKPSRPSSAASASAARRPPSGSSSKSQASSRVKPSKSVPTRRKQIEREEQEEEEEEDEDDNFDFPDEDEDDVEQDEDYQEEEEQLRPAKKRPPPAAASASKPPSRGGPPPRDRRGPPPRGPPRRREEDDYDDRPRRGGPPPPRGGRPPSGGRRAVVPYTHQQAGAFTRGLTALRESLPDPAAVRDAALSSITAARETSSKLTANIYREVKGLTSSELEQVMLKATRPDDSPVKGKHVERLVGVTYQISGRYDIYDAVLRKLWGKMAERDWRTTMKALYILHRFAADGAPEHQPALKARLRELRRTRDPKRKDKYFNSKQMLAGDSTPENIKFRAFLSRYAHFVLLRAQCFGGAFDEIGNEPPKVKKAPKPLTATSLRSEHLEAATMVLKAGIACQLKDGEDCENTALSVERVASDLIALTNAVAMALNRALKGTDSVHGMDAALIQKWCEFYSQELLPQTRSMVKKTSSKLDAYGLFLPSRMGTTVSPDVLQKGLNAVATKADEGEPVEDDEEAEVVVVVEDKEAREEPDAAKEEEEEEQEEEEEVEKEEKGEAVDEFADEEEDDQEANDDYEYYDDEEE